MFQKKLNLSGVPEDILIRAIAVVAPRSLTSRISAALSLMDTAALMDSWARSPPQATIKCLPRAAHHPNGCGPTTQPCGISFPAHIPFVRRWSGRQELSRLTSLKNILSSPLLFCT
jgi:hypothetical protein